MPKIYIITDDGWVYSTIFVGNKQLAKAWNKIPIELRKSIKYHDDNDIEKIAKYAFPYEKIIEFKHPRNDNYFLVRHLIDRSEWCFIGMEGLTALSKQEVIIKLFLEGMR